MYEKRIVVTPSLFKVDGNFDDDRFMKVRVAVMHSGTNLNKSSFATKVIRDAKDTFKNIPVLANVIKYTDENGEEHLDYGGHDAHVEEDAYNDGQYRLIYDEAVVGIIPESMNFEIIHDDDKDIDYVYVDALLYREYGNYACDVLEDRGGITDVSAEIYTDEISFDSKEQVIVVNKMRMAGVTLLGADVNPAMKGAHAEMFSLKEDDIQKQMIQVMKELKESLDKYAAIVGENDKEGGESGVTKFEELLEKYGKTVEDITFDYTDLSDEELEAAFEEHFAQSDESDPEAAEGEEKPEDVDDVDDEEVDDDDDEETKDEESDEEQNFAKMSVTYDGNIHEYSVSLQDKISALYTLVNNTYGDEDGCWYDVTVYDDEKYVIMVDYWSGKGYKQSYKVKKDVYTLVGDRVEVFSQWLTQDEINKLDKMKSDYSDMSEKLTHYEEEPQKLEILNSDDYSLIAENEEFIALKETENHFNMSIDEVTRKADEILTNAAKQHKFSITSDDKKVTTVKPLLTNRKKSKRFGSLFDGII